MAEFLSPGLFIEEVAAVQTVQAVSTSNMGIVGFTTQGPADEATLVTSFEQFSRVFGGFTKDSRVPLSMAAYFANGGLRAFVVRVLPGDATTADGRIQSTQTDQIVATGNGILGPAPNPFTFTATTSLFKDNVGATPVVPGSVTLRWREDAADSQTTIQALTRAGGALAGNGATTVFEGKSPGLTAGFDEELDQIVPGTFVLSWTSGAGAESIAFTATTSGIQTADNGVSQATVDLRTGIFTLETNSLAGAPDETPTATPINVAYDRTTTTKSVTDNGAGVWTGDATGTITYTDGAWTLTTPTNPVYDGGSVLATYNAEAWNIDPVSGGSWANDIRLDVRGNVDFFNFTTASYTRYDVNILQFNASAGRFEIKETYEEISFADPNSAVYFPDVINELSDLISIDVPAGLTAPFAIGQLNGIHRTKVLAAGDESAPIAITGTLGSFPLAARSISITYTDSTNVARTITDDGNGNLIGSVDPAGTNTINLSTGAFNLTTEFAINAGSLLKATYYSAPAEALHSEQLGDTSKQYTLSAVQRYASGSNGTFDATNYGRTQLTGPLLQAGNKGLFALNKVEELMQVIVPDLAGQVLPSKDIMDYVDSRESQPSGGDRFAILMVPQGSSAQQAVDFFRFDLNQQSKFTALYWPWVKVADPLSDNRPIVFPPLGHLAGIYARTDSTRNVAKTPAGTIDGALRFLTGLESISTVGERDLVYPHKINTLISSPQTGLVVWGARTISPDTQWRFIATRRLFMFLERAIFNATHWIVFENNGPGLWARIKAQLDSFLTALFNDGLFAGTSPTQAFFVVVDETNNTAESIDQGQVIIDVGVAPQKPSEFVRLRFAQVQLT
jgi:phage tail sheath protein FI